MTDPHLVTHTMALSATSSRSPGTGAPLPPFQCLITLPVPIPGLGRAGQTRPALCRTDQRWTNPSGQEHAWAQPIGYHAVPSPSWTHPLRPSRCSPALTALTRPHLARSRGAEQRVLPQEEPLRLGHLRHGRAAARARRRHREGPGPGAFPVPGRGQGGAGAATAAMATRLLRAAPRLLRERRGLGSLGAAAPGRVSR